MGEGGAEPPFRRVAIVGLGLIGGSVAFAVRRRWPEAMVVGVDRSEVVETARHLGAVRSGSSDLSAVAGADLVVLAAPVGANIALLPRLAGVVSGPAVVTDTGSTKRLTLEAARALPARLVFVGGHPLSGAARGGIEAARPDLFERRPWILTPDDHTPPDACTRLRAFVRELGAQPIDVDPARHDQLLAYTSHLPQLAASALMAVVGGAAGEAGLRLSGGGLADTTRVAGSPPAIWADICATNADEIGPALDRLLSTLGDLRARLQRGESIAPLFEEARAWRARLDR